MKQYTKMKESGIEWIGKIPKHWHVSKLISCLEKKNKKNNDERIREMLSVSQTLGIIKKEYDSELQIRSKQESLNYLVVEENDLVVNKMWIQYRGLGVSFINGIVSPAYSVYTTNPAIIHPEFLNHLVRSESFVKEYSRYLKGIRPNSLEISTYYFTRFPLLIPPNDEQKIIFEYVNKKIELFNSKIFNYKKFIELLKLKKQININELVTKGINSNIELKNSKIEWIGKIPKHWHVSKLLIVLEGSDIRNNDLVERKMLSVSQYLGIIEKEFESEELIKTKNETLRYLVVRPDDLVVNVMWLQFRGLGVSIIDGIVSPDYKVFKINTDIVFSKYLDYLLRSDVYLNEYPKHLRGIRPNSSRIKEYDFLRLPLILPPISEQKHISKILKENDIIVDKLITHSKSQIKLLEEYKQIFLSLIILGKIDVREVIA